MCWSTSPSVSSRPKTSTRRPRGGPCQPEPSRNGGRCAGCGLSSLALGPGLRAGTTQIAVHRAVRRSGRMPEPSATDGTSQPQRRPSTSQALPPRPRPIGRRGSRSPSFRQDTGTQCHGRYLSATTVPKNKPSVAAAPPPHPGRRGSRSPSFRQGCRNPVPRTVPLSHNGAQEQANRCRPTPAAADLAARRSGKDAGTQCHGRYLSATTAPKNKPSAAAGPPPTADLAARDPAKTLGPWTKDQPNGQTTLPPRLTRVSMASRLRTEQNIANQ